MAFHGVLLPKLSEIFKLQSKILEVHGQTAAKANLLEISDSKPSLVQLDANPSGEPFP